MAKLVMRLLYYSHILGIDVIRFIRLFRHLIDIVGNNSHTVQQGRKLFQVHNIQLGVEGAVPDERRRFHIAGFSPTLDLRPLLHVECDLFLFYDLVLSRYCYHSFCSAILDSVSSYEGYCLGLRVP